MELDKVKQVVETTSVEEVNQFIEHGWVLLAIASMNTDSREDSSPWIKYSLAWAKDGDPVKPRPSYPTI